LENSSEKLDVIIMDLTDQIDLGPSFPLYTVDFYRTVREHLTSEGVLVIQSGALTISDHFSHCTIRKTLGTQFKTLSTYVQFIPSFFSEWSFIVATNKKEGVGMSQAQVDKLLKERVNGPLRFYDGETHGHMFALPKNLRAVMEEAGTIVTNRADFMVEFQRLEENTLSVVNA
jgi:spermidine synthase